ncbi:MAG: TIGR00289 family protein [Candidatus Thermoplasmatota archaeon]|nr:TIGR00289 family protein [Candidatus Thermoplasmatota archaeon]
MKIACLISGGKDSLYALYIALQYGWDITHIVTISPKKLSWMYHTENIHLVDSVAESMRIPLIKKESYANKEEELEDLKSALNGLAIDGIVSGAIASEYQRTRIEKVCHELNIKSFMPLWHKKEEILMEEMIEAGFDIMIVAVAAEGLGEKWLGRIIDKDCLEELIQIRERYDINVSGEGGEYETFVLDCPLYRKKLVIEESEKERDGERVTLNIKKVGMKSKE